jgi:hypothetical protein
MTAFRPGWPEGPTDATKTETAINVARIVRRSCREVAATNVSLLKIVKLTV